MRAAAGIKFMPAVGTGRRGGISVVVHFGAAGAAEDRGGVDKHGPKLMVSELGVAQRASKILPAAGALIGHHVQRGMPMLAPALRINRAVNLHGRQHTRHPVATAASFLQTS